MDVSIHAPTKGATKSRCPLFSNYVCFNPRTHEGCDEQVKRYKEAGLFQSTHPRRVRPLCQVSAPSKHCVSIHAPTKGATALTNLLKYSLIDMPFCENIKKYPIRLYFFFYIFVIYSLSMGAKRSRNAQHYSFASNYQLFINIHHHLLSY